jgi:hypothetical protein
VWVALGQSGQNPGRIQMEIDFQISIEFGFWQDFENFGKEIKTEFRHGNCWGHYPRYRGHGLWPKIPDMMGFR